MCTTIGIGGPRFALVASCTRSFLVNGTVASENSVKFGIMLDGSYFVWGGSEKWGRKVSGALKRASIAEAFDVVSQATRRAPPMIPSAVTIAAAFSGRLGLLTITADGETCTLEEGSADGTHLSLAWPFGASPAVAAEMQASLIADLQTGVGAEDAVRAAFARLRALGIKYGPGAHLWGATLTRTADGVLTIQLLNEDPAWTE